MSTLKALLKDVPVEWKALGDVVSISNTGVDKKVNTDERPVRLLNFVDIFKNKYITNETPNMVVTATDKKIADCDVKKFDIFITPSSELIDEIGFSALAIEDLKNTVYSYHIMRLRTIDLNKVYPHYLNYLFASNDVRKQIRQKAQGITRYGLTQPNWKSIQIPIPYPNDPEKSLAIQQEIVRVLDGLSEQNKALTGALAQEIDQRKKQYEYYREEMFRFEGKEVEWKTLGEVADMKAGKHISASKISDKNNTAHEFPCFGGNGIRGYVDKFSHDGNHLFIGRQGALCGNVQRYNGRFYATEHAVVVTPNYFLNIDYLFHLLIFMNLNQYATKSAQPGLAVGKLETLKIPVPAIQEQERIVHLLDQFDAATKNIVAQLEKEIELRNKQYEYYRNQLLAFRS